MIEPIAQRPGHSSQTEPGGAAGHAPHATATDGVSTRVRVPIMSGEGGSSSSEGACGATLLCMRLYGRPRSMPRDPRRYARASRPSGGQPLSWSIVSTVSAACLPPCSQVCPKGRTFTPIRCNCRGTQFSDQTHRHDVFHGETVLLRRIYGQEPDRASTGHARHHNERPVSAWTRNVHRTEWMLLDIRLIAFSPLECMAPDVIVLTHIAFDELSNRNIASTRSQTSRYNRSQTVLVDHFEEGGAQLGPVSQVNAHGSSRSQKRNHRRSLPDTVRQHAIRHRALLARIEPELSVGVSSARRGK